MVIPNFLHFGALLSTLTGRTLDNKGIQVSNIVGNPIITNWGTWGEWEYCPNGTYVVGMQLKTEYDQGIFADNTALNGVKFYCDKIGSNDGNATITSKVGHWGDYHNNYICEGVATGFQFLSEPSLGPFGDDTAASNMRLACDGQLKHGDGETWGVWTEPQYCRSKFAICGLRTQVEDTTTDNTALNNIQVLCCEVPDPAELCKPVDSWELIMECDNFNSTSETTCTYEKKIGTSHSETKSESQSTMHDIYSNIGFTTTTALASLPVNFGTNLGVHSITGYDWTQSSEDDWKEETTTTVSMKVEAGIIKRLYQAVGKCDFYTVRPNMFHITNINKYNHYTLK